MLVSKLLSKRPGIISSWSDRYRSSLSQSKLPVSLSHLRHSFQWPIKMNYTRSFLNLNGDLEQRSKALVSHLGIDIHCNPETPVKCSEGGKVIFYEEDDRFDDSLSDVYILGDSGLTWVYRHLDRASIPEKIRNINEYDETSNIRIETGSPIGNVGFWGDFLTEADNASSFHRRIFNNRADHLHLEVHPLNRSQLKEINAVSLNPLLLLKRLN